MVIANHLALPVALGATLLADARRDSSVEICGVIAAASDAPPRHYPITNRASRASDRFDMDPAGQIAVFKLMRERRLRLIAIYHSHPTGEAEPSIHDQRATATPMQQPSSLRLTLTRAKPSVPGIWRALRRSRSQSSGSPRRPRSPPLR